MNSIRNTIRGNFLLIICYLVAAQLTQSLAVHPSGAVPLWAPTGIALGAVLVWGNRLLPGVFVSDFLVEMSFVGLSDITALGLCNVVGLQAMLHAWLAKRLLIRFKLWPTSLSNERDIIRFLLLIGLVASFFPALLTTAVELLLGLLNSNSWLNFLIVWWFGGALGAAIFTPIMLVLFAEPKDSWRSRISLVALPMIVLFLLLVLILHVVREEDREQLNNRFMASAELTHTLIEGELNIHQILLKSMGTFFKHPSSLTQQAFDDYFTEFSHYQEDIYAVAWAEYVTDAERSLYEQQQGEIVELDELNGVVVRAAQRAAYFVIKYTQVPSEYAQSLNNRNTLQHFDMCAGVERTRICQDLQKHRMAMIMSPILKTAPPRQRFVYVLPVFSSAKKIVGLAAHMYEYQRFFGGLLNSSGQQWLDLEIADITAVGSPKILFDSGKDAVSLNMFGNQHVLLRKTLHIGGQQWQFSYRPNQDFVEHNSSWVLYWVMTGAFVVLSMTSAFLLNITGREQRIKQEVESKTKEIREQVLLLEASEHKFRCLVEGVQHDYLLYAHDLEGAFTYISPSVEAMLGYNSDEFLVHYWDYLPDTALNRLVEGYTDRTLQGEVVAPYELEIFDKQGQLHTLLISGTAALDRQGQIMGVEGIAQDITQLKATRMQLEKLSLAVTHSPNAVVITDKEGIIEYVNPKFTEITAYKAEEIQGKWLSILNSNGAAETVYNDLLFAGSEWQGELQNRKKNGDLFWAHEYICPMFAKDGTVTHFVATLEDITEARQLRQETSYQASHDLLTGLVNRREFEARLQRVVNSANQGKMVHALCFLDLDQFKIVNDTCGHIAGDELLRQVGSLMQANIRTRDTLARLGGDEFAILMEHCDIDHAYRAAEHMIHALEGFRFHWQEHTFTIGVSIGLSIIDQHTRDSQEALSQVDSACYAAKDAGRNRIEVHTEGSERLKQRKGEIKWSSEISEALDNDHFLLYVQPIVPVLKVNVAQSYEILLRLKMQDGTVVPPGAFLPAAERYNSIARIDRWVVRHTLMWLSQHAAQLQDINSIAINLSGQSLGDESMLAFIIGVFEESDVPAEKIKFEITETAAVANLQDATVFMRTLSKLGCRFALDDFGSGLSSFAYLKNLHVDILKIDGMFVKDMLDDPIDYEMVKSINQIGHVMGLETVAEFVESESVLDKLRSIGVDYAQGYHVGEPMPIGCLLSSNRG